MEKRINVQQTEPDAYKAMFTLEGYLQKTQLTDIHKELIKIRASQINGCAYCLNMHTQAARKYGETEQRIYMLSAWKETSLFTEEEKTILALTEEITLISKGGVSKETYCKAEELFDKNYLAQIIMAVVIINSWNRIAVSTLMEIE